MCPQGSIRYRCNVPGVLRVRKPRWPIDRVRMSPKVRLSGEFSANKDIDSSSAAADKIVKIHLADVLFGDMNTVFSGF